SWSCDDYLVTHIGARVDADGYDITAKGDNVAFAVAGEGGDVVLLESTDRGLTWTETVIYDIDESGNTPGHEPSDGSVSVIYDADTQLHVAWGSFLYDDDGFLVESRDAGIRHWSAVTGVQEIAWPDPDSSIVNPGGRDGNLATGPDLCAAEDGSLFMVFSRFIGKTDSNGNNYEHVFGIGSTYAGMDWQTVVDMTPGTGFDAAFPSAADLVDDYVHFTYTSDPYAGNWIRGTHEQVAVAYMVHKVEKSAFFTVGVRKEGEVPPGFSLQQNFPNPFNGISNVEFRIGATSDVSLRVFDILGREVARLADGRYLPGQYRVQWDAPRLPTGVYWYRLEAVMPGGSTAGFADSRKMILLR
ncbi:MAG: T9SS type A sorting domain-containing protein, partial [Ignavibacteria bacterium]|nr:T9SS type A sorting domain-containing protein [Ignavibacteria bacterium]